jgi:hypothetical protein
VLAVAEAVYLDDERQPGRARGGQRQGRVERHAVPRRDEPRALVHALHRPAVGQAERLGRIRARPAAGRERGRTREDREPHPP